MTRENIENKISSQELQSNKPTAADNRSWDTQSKKIMEAIASLKKTQMAKRIVGKEGELVEISWIRTNENGDEESYILTRKSREGGGLPVSEQYKINGDLIYFINHAYLRKQAIKEMQTQENREQTWKNQFDN